MWLPWSLPQHCHASLWPQKFYPPRMVNITDVVSLQHLAARQTNSLSEPDGKLVPAEPRKENNIYLHLVVETHRHTKASSHLMLLPKAKSMFFWDTFKKDLGFQVAFCSPVSYALLSPGKLVRYRDIILGKEKNKAPKSFSAPLFPYASASPCPTCAKLIPCRTRASLSLHSKWVPPFWPTVPTADKGCVQALCPSPSFVGLFVFSLPEVGLTVGLSPEEAGVWISQQFKQVLWPASVIKCIQGSPEEL